MSLSSNSPLLDTPSLSPSCTSASRSSIASSNSSLSLGDLGSRISKAHIHSQVSHEMTELFDLQRASRKFAHDSNTFSGARERDIEEELLDSDMDKGSNQYDRGRSGYEDCYDERDHTLLLPPNIPRQGFNSKRHPSFDAPREVPFPCGHLTSPVSPLLCHPQHGPSTNVPMCLQDGPGRWSPSQMDADGDSPDGNVNNASESSPSLWPNMEHLSTTSLPLPTFMPYTVLPPLSTPVPPSRFNDGRTPPQVRQSSLNTTESGLEPSMAPGTTLLQPPEAEFKSTIKLPSPANVTHPSRLPGRMSTEPPPLLTDELHATDLAPSHESSQPSSLDSTPHHDTRPHNSLPPPPKISSFSFTSAPLARPTSLPHSIVNGSLDSQLTSCSGGSRFPPPQPPTVLTPPPPPSATENTRTRAPYEPFLPRDQPPPDRTYIAVETLNTEYRLIIRLFGFQRDSITLAMRRRRILHVVADNWSDGGGHYERRISFGYDADLTNVRAEFDGEILRVTVPRRAPSGWYTQPT